MKKLFLISMVAVIFAACMSMSMAFDEEDAVDSYTVTFASNDNSWGTVTTSSGTSTLTVDSGTTYIIDSNYRINFSDGQWASPTPTADTSTDEYEFSDWSSYSGTVTGNMTITATFNHYSLCTVYFVASPSSSYGFLSTSSITVRAGEYFNTTSSSSGGTVTMSDGQTVTATPRSDTASYDYYFNGWSQSSNVVLSNTTVIAYFDRTAITPSSYQVTVYPGNYDYFYWKNGSDTTHYSSTHTYTVSSGGTLNIDWIGDSDVSGSGTNYTYVTTYNDCSNMVTTSGYPGGGTDSVTVNSGTSYYPADIMVGTTTYIYQYTIVYNAGDGTGAPGNTTATSTAINDYDHSQAYTTITLSPTEPTRSGYSFSGWKDTNDNTYYPGQSYTFNAGTTTLTAQWTQNSYLVTVYPGNYDYFYWKNGSDTTHYTSAHSYTGVLSGTTFDIEWVGETSTYIDYVYTAVTTKSSCSNMVTTSGYPGGGTDSVTIMDNASYYPALEMTSTTAYTYTYEIQFIGYDADQGSPWPTTVNETVTVSTPPSYDYYYYSNVTIPNVTPVRTGYTFLGWSESQNTSVADYIPNQTYSLDAGHYQFYAVWQSNLPSYQVTVHLGDYQYFFDAENNPDTVGVYSEDHTYTVVEGTTLDIFWRGHDPNPVIASGTGYTQRATYSACNNMVTTSGYPGGGTDSVTVLGNADYYPADPVTITYITDYTFVLTFNANGGSGSLPATIEDTLQTNVMMDPTTTKNIRIPSTPTPTRVGYVFMGWADGYSLYQSGDLYQAPFGSTTLYAVWDDAPEYTVTINVNNGTYGSVDIDTINSVAYNSPITTYENTLTVNGTTVTATANPGFVFDHWGNATGPVTSDMMIMAYFIPEHAVSWCNDLYNGEISVAFMLPSSASVHNMIMPLYTATVNDRDEATWTQTNYVLTVSSSTYGNNTIISCQLEDSNGVVSSGSYTMGTWSHFILTINTASGFVRWTPMDTFTDFTNYTTMDGLSQTLFTWDAPENATVYTIQHYDSGSGNPARFSVVNTLAFLNTYGVVLYNPSINVYDYFPQYDKVQVSIYSFAVYGETMTINGKTWAVTGSDVTIYYTEQEGEYFYATSSTMGAQSKTLTLNNIYVTWDGSDCLLTFASDKWTVNLGSYSNGSKTLSFSGLWYFTISLNEPYTASKTEITGEWDSMLNVDTSVILLLFLGVIILLGLIAHVKLKMKWLDALIIVVALIVAYSLLR